MGVITPCAENHANHTYTDMMSPRASNLPRYINISKEEITVKCLNDHLFEYTCKILPAYLFFAWREYIVS